MTLTHAQERFLPLSLVAEVLGWQKKQQSEGCGDMPGPRCYLGVRWWLFSRKPLLAEAENFTLFIKNTVHFTKFNFSR